MHEIFNHNGKEFECDYNDGGRIIHSKGIIKIEDNSAYILQNDFNGSHPRSLDGFKCAYTYINLSISDSSREVYRSARISNFKICDNSSLEDQQVRAEKLAKKLLFNGSDEEMDAFINGYIMGYNKQ